MSPLSLWRGFPSHLWEAGCNWAIAGVGRIPSHFRTAGGQPWRSMELPVGMGCPVTCPGRCGPLYLQVAPEHSRGGSCTFPVNSFAFSTVEIATPGTAQVWSPGPPAFLGFLSLSGSRQGEPAGGNPGGSSFFLSGTHTQILPLQLGSPSPGSSPEKRITLPPALEDSLEAGP